MAPAVSGTFVPQSINIDNPPSTYNQLCRGYFFETQRKMVKALNTQI